MSQNSYEKIYEVVKQIPKGTVATYGQVAALALAWDGWYGQPIQGTISLFFSSSESISFWEYLLEESRYRAKTRSQLHRHIVLGR